MTIKQLFRTLYAVVAICMLLPLTANAQSIEINAENFPDENFRNWLLEQDYGQDGVITEEEINGITEIIVGGKNISSLQGIEHFTALTYLSCWDTLLTSLNVSNNTELIELNCSRNQLTSLDVSGCIALRKLQCYRNQLTSLDVSGCIEMEYLSCSYNQLTSLDVSGCIALKELYCNYNQLTTLDVSECTALEFFHCHYNQLASLDVSPNTILNRLFCCNNQINKEAMDILVNSLPQKTTAGEYEFVVYNNGDNEVYDTDGEYKEDNICTKVQVAVVKAKGWTPYDFVGGNVPKEYEGCDEGAEGIDAVHTGKDGNNDIYTLDGMKVNTKNLSDLPTGIYIVNSKKVLVK